MAGELVSGIKVLKTQVVGTVRIGFTKTEQIDTQVRLSLSDPEVKAALEPLVTLIRQRGSAFLLEASTEEARRQIKADAYTDAHRAAEHRIDSNTKAVILETRDVLEKLKLVGPRLKDEDYRKKFNRGDLIRILQTRLDALKNL